MLIGGTLINIGCFLVAAASLFLLTIEIYGQSTSSAHHAFIVAVLFSFNPASIFYTAIYTEALFSALLFTGMLLLRRHSVMLASFVRPLSIFRLLMPRFLPPPPPHDRTVFLRQRIFYTTSSTAHFLLSSTARDLLVVASRLISHMSYRSCLVCCSLSRRISGFRPFLVTHIARRVAIDRGVTPHSPLCTDSSKNRTGTSSSLRHIHC